MSEVPPPNHVPVPAPAPPHQTPEQAVAQGLMKLLAPLSMRYAPWLVAGLGIFGGIEQGTNASANYVELSKKFDKFAEELQEVRKELAERKAADAAAVARAQAERHEERLRALEEHAQECKLARAAKGEAPK